MRHAGTRVVVHFRWWIRLLTSAVGVVFGVAAWASIWQLCFGDPGDTGPWTRALIVALLLPCAVTCTVAAYVSPLMKMTYSPDEITIRTLIRFRRIPFAQATAIRQVRAAVHTGVRQIPVGRLQVLGDPAHGFRGFAVRAALDSSMSHWREAMDVLDTWVRRRPELVADDPGARAVFAARGAISVAGAPPPDLSSGPIVVGPDTPPR